MSVSEKIRNHPEFMWAGSAANDAVHAFAKAMGLENALMFHADATMDEIVDRLTTLAINTRIREGLTPDVKGRMRGE